MTPSPKLIGKYEILEELGRGGFAVVYKARDTRMGREVALKVIHGNFAKEPDFVARFKLEVQTAAGLRHPNIVTVYDFDDADGELYLAMELIAGSSLRAYLDDRKRLTLDQALPILKQVAEALDYLAGQQLVHRDVKPANILLEREGDRLLVKLTDFGLVRSLESSTQLTQTLSVMGTPAYMAPEQADAKQWGGITSATDVYALGVVTYEMLCGRPPFEGETLTVMHAHAYDPPPSPLEVVPDLGADLEAVLLPALNKTPSTRYVSAMALMGAIQQVQIARQQQSQQQSELADLLGQVQAAQQAKNWQKVIRICGQIMHIDRSHPDLPRWLTEATTEFQRENAEEALRRQRAKRYEEGEAALNAGQWAIAIESFEEVAQGNPDFREVQQKLTAARDELQRSLLYDEAIALGEAQQWPEATSMWLKVLRDRMDYHGGDAALRFTEAVRRLLDQWLILNETLAQSQQDLSAARRLLSDFDALGVTMNAHSWTEAIELAERLLSVSPDLLQPAVWLGDARRELELAEAHAKVPAVQLSLPESVAKLSGADRLMWLVDGKEMVRVPAGGFLFGDQNEKIDLPEFWIDKAPVTNAEYARFVAAKKYFPPAHWSGWQPPKDLIDHPVVNVSWIDAVAYANWANKRLPTEQEWEKAARGTDGRVYPWGDQEPTDKLCNFGQNVKNTTLVGKYSPQGDSPYGCVDMAGNVWEWTASDYDQSSKVLRSGSWSVDAYNVRTTGRNYITPDGRNVIFGFRCVVSPGG